MRPLIIGSATKAAFRGLVSWAETHPMRLPELRALRAAFDAGQKVGVSSEPNRVLTLPFGWRIVFSLEEHGPGNWVRHASVSVSSKDGKDLPNQFMVERILNLLGFENGLEGPNFVFLEGPPAFRQCAVNVLEVVTDPIWDSSS